MAITKWLRKKKTLTELKEEESILSQEKRKLKNEFTTKSITVEKQRAGNEELKIMKLDLQTNKSGQLVASSKAAKNTCLDQTQQTYTTCGPSNVLPFGVACNDFDDPPQICPPKTPTEVKGTGSNQAAYLLPDLNMPAGEDTISDILCELSGVDEC